MTVCGTMNCVIVSSKYIVSISVLYLSCFICYKLLQLLKYTHIFSVYTKMRLFKSQKTRGIHIVASDQKFIFVNQCYQAGNERKSRNPKSRKIQPETVGIVNKSWCVLVGLCALYCQLLRLDVNVVFSMCVYEDTYLAR